MDQTRHRFRSPAWHRSFRTYDTSSMGHFGPSPIIMTVSKIFAVSSWCVSQSSLAFVECGNINDHSRNKEFATTSANSDHAQVPNIFDWYFIEYQSFDNVFYNFVEGDACWVFRVQPPSRMTWAPVTCAEAAEDRKRATPARSRGIPVRPMGTKYIMNG